MEENIDLWGGSENISEAFKRSGERTDVPLSTFLHQVGKVVLPYDPAVIEVFGFEAVEAYEKRLDDLSP